MTKPRTMLLLALSLTMLAGSAVTASDYGSASAMAFEKGKYDKALKYAKKAVKLDPTNPHAWYWLGMSCAKKELWGEAIEALRKRIELDPAGEQYQPSHVWLAVAYYRTGQIDEGLAMATRAVELEPQDNDAQKILARFKWEKKQIVAQGFRDRIEQAAREGDFATAVTELRRSRGIPEMDAVSWAVLAGDVLLGFCDYDDAVAMYEEAVFLSPSDDAWMKPIRARIGQAYLMKGDAENARQYRGGLGYIGVELETRGDEVVAAGILPGQPAAEAGLQAGDVFLEAGGATVKLADDVVTCVAQTEPGRLLTLRIRRDGQVFDRTITVGSIIDLGSKPYLPSACRAQALNREGVALARNGDSAGALKKFEEALQTAPGPMPKAHYNAALVLEKTGRFEEALAHYVEAQGSFLRSQDEIEALGKLTALTARERIRVPDSADHRYRVGIVRTQQKRYREAIEEFEAALAEAPWIIDAYYNLGLVYDFNADYAKALRVLRVYVALAPDSPRTGTVKTKIVELEDRLGQLGTMSRFF